MTGAPFLPALRRVVAAGYTARHTPGGLEVARGSSPPTVLPYVDSIGSLVSAAALDRIAPEARS